MFPADLAARLGASPKLVSGRLHVLNLDRLAAHFAERWPKVRERALDVAEQTLQAGLGPADLLHKSGETSWLMFFPTTDKATAQTRCALLAERVYRRLIGDDTRFNDVNIRTVVIETDGRTVMESADPLTLIQSALDMREAKEAEAAAHPHAGHQTRIEDEPETVPDGIQFRFVPMIDVERNLVNTYGCEAWREAAGGVVVTSHGVLLTGDRSPLAWEVDVRSLTAGIAALRAIRACGGISLIGVEVHCRSLERSESRRAILGQLETLAEEEKRLLAFRLVGLPVGAPIARITYAVGFLKRFCRAVIVGRPLRHLELDRLVGTGAFGVNANLGNLPMEERSLSASLADMVAGTARAGLKAMVSGLATPGLAACAVTAGASHIDGNGVMPPIEHPQGLVPFSCEQLVRGADPRKATGAPVAAAAH